MKLYRLALSISLCLCLLLALARIDRLFFKQNKGFKIQMILSTLRATDAWNTPPLTPNEQTQFAAIVSQPFYYLNRGGQSAAFISEDNRYVLKFYRFPSHLRPLGWLQRPLAYHFRAKRKEIEAHNLEKLNLTFQSYLLAQEHLKEESALVTLHLNPTDTLACQATLIDALGNHYLIDLDRVPFLLQRRADPIYPTLQALLDAGLTSALKAHLDSLLHLVALRCSKGIIDNDPVLEQNYGFIDTQAIHIDIGRLAADPSLKTPEGAKKHLEALFHPLLTWLQEKDPHIAAYFRDKLETTTEPNSLRGTSL